MRFKHSITLASLAAIAFAGLAAAQTTVSTGTGQGGSPHEKTTWKVGAATISVEYGRPYLKGRPEAQLMPLGSPWRTGADQATVITTDKPLTFDKVSLAPGSYTINTEPGAKEWHLILGKLGSAGQWGIPYLPNLEIGRATMRVGHLAKPVEQVTVEIDKAAPALRIEWGATSATVPFKVGG
ncbi:MAG: DUF2911 domain-containing protein [bacterium]